MWGTVECVELCNTVTDGAVGDECRSTEEAFRRISRVKSLQHLEDVKVGLQTAQALLVGEVFVLEGSPAWRPVARTMT